MNLAKAFNQGNSSTDIAEHRLACLGLLGADRIITIFPRYAEELEPSSKRNTNGTTFAGFWLLDEYQMISAFHVHIHRSETAIEVDILAAIVTAIV